MKITLAMVMSLDSKTTRWHEPNIHSWTSKEDQTYFAKLLAEQKLVIMGRKTFEAAGKSIQPTPGLLYTVITRNPEAHTSIPGQLEFRSEKPKELIHQLEKQGFTEGLLAGGAELNTAFLQAGLVNEVWITLELTLFGSGNSLTLEKELDIPLELLGVEQLNKEGTLLLKYKIPA